MLIMKLPNISRMWLELFSIHSSDETSTDQLFVNLNMTIYIFVFKFLILSVAQLVHKLFGKSYNFTSPYFHTLEHE